MNVMPDYKPLVDQYKPKTPPNFTNRKIPRFLIGTTQLWPGDKNILFKKIWITIGIMHYALISKILFTISL